MSKRSVVIALAAPVLLLGLGEPAAADNCAKSRDYILEGLAGDLERPGKAYQDLFKVCLEASALPNVKDAYVLKAGVIAIDPTRNTVMATATTLARFCQRFPRRAIRFFTPGEQRHPRTVGLVVMMSATTASSCQKMRGDT